MLALNLPRFEARIQTVDGKSMIFDPIRRKFVRLTPEEWVRQHMLNYLVTTQRTPASLVAVEKGFVYQGMARRADIVVHDRRGQALLVAECKAPDVAIQQATFDQVARYNKVIQAAYLVVTNGLEHYCCAIDRTRHTYEFLDAIPAYDAL